MKNCKVLLTFLLLTQISIGMAQSEQDGVDLAASFPKITEGNLKPDLPSNGFYWQKDNPGIGINLEVQSRRSVSTGYFLFMTGYFYDENGDQFWCAISDEYKYNEDVNQWRDNKNFSNLPFGHNDLPVLAEQDVVCNVVNGGTPLGSNNHVDNEIVRSINIHLLWRNPSYLELTAEGGEMQVFERFGWGNDLVNPTIDWVMDYEWLITSSVPSYNNDNDDDPKTNKFIRDYNVKTKFEILDVEEQQSIKDFVGHEESFIYYISTIKASYKLVTYNNYESSLFSAYEPYISGYGSNVAWIVLVHDKEDETVALYTVAGEKTPGDLRPNAGIGIKFIAKVNPDADIIDFYPLKCKGIDIDCERTARTYRNTDMADWSDQNIHRSTMKMFKFRTGGEAYLYQPNTGESDSQSMNRIKQQLIDK